MASDATKKDKKSKDKSVDKKEKKDKKRSEEGGIHKEKKDKKKDKDKKDKLSRALDVHLSADTATKATAASAAATSIAKVKREELEEIIKGGEALVPFSLPLADEKTHKKIYKLIKKGAKLKAISRGTKECEKAIKKFPVKTATSTGKEEPKALVIIAGDISPPDVIMHFPVLCEEHMIPYLFIRSRADLGTAACTKRATSIVMLRPNPKAGAAGSDEKKSSKKSKQEEDEDMTDGAGESDKKASPEEYLEGWKEMVNVARTQWNVQVEPWVKGIHPLQIAAASTRD